MMLITNKNTLLLVLIFLSTLFLGYGIDRVSLKFFTPFSFEVFISTIILTFSLLFVFIRDTLHQWKLKEMILLGAIVRLVLLFTEPNLSDDYFRYIWDGILVEHGVNPYLYLPSELISNPEFSHVPLSQQLYNGFNSQHYYSVYPPVNQFIFFLSSWFGQDHLWINGFVIRVLVFVAEIGSMYFLLQLLKQENISLKLGFWYILNPLILLEFTVNLHFESFMTCFLLAALYFLSKQKYIQTGIFWALAICTKIIPVIYMVFLLKRLKVKHWFLVGLVSLACVLILFLPFWNVQIIANIKDSLDKYFGYFEFNAGIPYFIRYIGNEIYGYSILFRVMPVIKQIFVVFVLFYGFSSFLVKKVKTIYSPIYWTAFVYFLLAGILHPWYITILIPLGLLSRNYTGIVWSGLIFLSYSAYQSPEYQENYMLISLEYILVFAFMIYENTMGKVSLLIGDKS
ncbi:MAG: glycosyltransferase 87 family protein [Flavobacteriales bacterium]